MLFTTLALLNVTNDTNAVEDEFTMTTPIVNINVSEEYNLAEDAFAQMPQEMKITSAIGVTLLSFVAFVGNTMTIVAHISDAKLHTVYDFYIFNLAIADLFIACFSIPLYVVYTLYGYWPFGVVVCKLWILMDYSVCTETIFLMLILSIDRLFLVTLELQYAVKVTMTKAKIQIVISWILSFLIHTPTVIGWDSFVGYSSVPAGECFVEFAYNVDFALVHFSLGFVIPTVVLIVLNIVIFWKVKRRINCSYMKTAYNKQQFNSTEVIENKEKQHVIQIYTVNPITTISSESKTEKAESETETASSAFKPEIVEGITETTGSVFRQDIVDVAPKSTDQKDTMFGHFHTNPIKLSQNAHRIRTHRQLKAARVLFILVLVYSLCLAPYFLLTLAITLCTTCVRRIVFEFFYWWAWVKSAANPFLYAFNNKQYRLNFRRYVFIFCHCRIPQTRENT